tara:strand:- start:138 stop:266 length:129 start_codon:yes stop_codon:yes gene_type:complete
MIHASFSRQAVRYQAALQATVGLLHVGHQQAANDCGRGEQAL